MNAVGIDVSNGKLEYDRISCCRQLVGYAVKSLSD